MKLYQSINVIFFIITRKFTKNHLQKIKKKSQEKSGILHKLPKFLFIYFLFFEARRFCLKLAIPC